MVKLDYDKFRNSVVEGCVENIFDENYMHYFLSKNNMNYFEDACLIYENQLLEKTVKKM